MLSNSSNSSNLFSFSYRKVYGYVAIILIVLLMSWEYQKVDAALHMESIPEESIRLRILANSDSPNDQLIKAVVRDEVVAAMNSWITEPLTIEEAREVLKAHESQLQDVIATTLANNGYKYGFTTEIGQVEFPTKMYGQLVYPAGMYEALLIALGEGAGRNWWCVLFPPLCFADTVSGEATANPSVEAAVATTTPEVDTASDSMITQEVETATVSSTDVEVDFFIVELFENLGAWISSLFA